MSPSSLPSLASAPSLVASSTFALLTLLSSSRSQDTEPPTPSTLLAQSLLPALRLQLLPKSQLDVFLLVLESDGMEGVVSAGTTVAGAALAGVGGVVEMSGLVVGVSLVSGHERRRFEGGRKESETLTSFRSFRFNSGHHQLLSARGSYVSRVSDRNVESDACVHACAGEDYKRVADWGDRAGEGYGGEFGSSRLSSFSSFASLSRSFASPGPSSKPSSRADFTPRSCFVFVSCPRPLRN